MTGVRFLFRVTLRRHDLANQPMTTRQFGRLFKQAAKAVGLRKTLSLHSLRHSFATHLLERGTDIRVIQASLGHDKLETTARYTRVAIEIIAKIESPLKGLNAPRHRQAKQATQAKQDTEKPAGAIAPSVMVRPVLEVADILRDHAPAWREANRDHVSLDQLKVMSAIERCGMAGKSPVTASDELRAGLLALADLRDRGEADRARAVLLTLAGWTSSKIAEAFGVREDTVRLWRSDFTAGGVAALKTSIAPGPPPVKSEAALRVVTPLLEEPVADRRNWTIPRLRAEIEAREGVRISRSQLSKALRKKVPLAAAPVKTLQRLSSVHAQVHNHFTQERHLVTRQTYKQRRSAALAEWRALAA